MEEEIIEIRRSFETQEEVTKAFTMLISAPKFHYADIPKTKRYGKVVNVRTEPKIRRNQKCPCGSELKHKWCCCLNK